MKHIKLLLIAISILFAMNVYSQQIPLSLEDLIPGGKSFSKYRIEMPRQLTWWGEKLIYLQKDTVMLAPVNEKDKPSILFTLSQFNEELAIQTKKVKSIYDFIFPSSSNAFLLFKIASEEKDGSYNLHLYDTIKKDIVASYNCPKEAENIDFSLLGQQLSYTIDNNVYLAANNKNNIRGERQNISNETDINIVSGQAVHRNEFGIIKGTFWSPQGNLLAYYRMDESMVTDYPLVDMNTRTAKLKNIKYPMAGMKSHQVTVGIYNPQTKKTVFLKTGSPKEKYLTNIAWSKNEKSVYIAELNRTQDTCTVNRYNASTGKLDANLFSETHTKYVEPENPILFLKNDSTLFIWQSKRDGFNHLYLYDTNGSLLKQITTGKWDITAVIGFDEKGTSIIYTSTEESPIEKHIYQVNIKTGKRTKLSKEVGTHTAQISTSGKYISDTYTSQYNPGKVSVTDTKTNKTACFYEAKNPYKNIELPEITLGGLIPKEEGPTLFYRIVKPLHFDPNKKYPVIVYVYGGPHSQLVDDSWMAQARGWDIYMAEKGYIVFTLDNRGTLSRGFEFENSTHHQLGVLETEDQMKGVEYLKSLPYVDASRIGVHGWSYGGFMTLNLMLRQPNTFKVGVAGGPVTDWKYYEIMYGERYMGTPKNNPLGYKDTSMIDRAGDLKGRLLLIHGDEDPTVVMQQSSQFLKLAIEKGTHPDFFVYPGHGHNMTGHDRVHLHEHITRYFDDFLK